MLASHATGLTRIELYTSFDKPLSEEERAVLRDSIQRRLAGEPLQYIRGRVGFRHLELMVRAPVLIPRPETELLVELVLRYASERELTQARILDIGTGSGAIALSLLYELPGCELVATDIDEAALSLARSNAEELGLESMRIAEENSSETQNQPPVIPAKAGTHLKTKTRLRLHQDDLASTLLENEINHGSFDVVVSNPPYIPTAEYECLPPEILQFESREALDGGADGLVTFRRLAEQTALLLKPGGLLAVELHEDTLEEAVACAQSLLFHQVQIQQDLTNRNRFLVAVRSEQ